MESSYAHGFLVGRHGGACATQSQYPANGQADCRASTSGGERFRDGHDGSGEDHAGRGKASHEQAAEEQEGQVRATALCLLS
eukprot:3360054-Pleurochrysis_carterae.AAC.1